MLKKLRPILSLSLSFSFSFALNKLLFIFLICFERQQRSTCENSPRRWRDERRPLLVGPGRLVVWDSWTEICYSLMQLRYETDPHLIMRLHVENFTWEDCTDLTGVVVTCLKMTNSYPGASAGVWLRGAWRDCGTRGWGGARVGECAAARHVWGLGTSGYESNRQKK